MLPENTALQLCLLLTRLHINKHQSERFTASACHRKKNHHIHKITLDVLPDHSLPVSGMILCRKHFRQQQTVIPVNHEEFVAWTPPTEGSFLQHAAPSVGDKQQWIHLVGWSTKTYTSFTCYCPLYHAIYYILISRVITWQGRRHKSMGKLKIWPIHAKTP